MTPKKSDLIEVLHVCRDYFDNRADVVDGDCGKPEPNREMAILAQIDAALVGEDSTS